MCPGNHKHEILKAISERVVYRAKLAQVYPWDLCGRMATDIAAIWKQPFAHVALSFELQSFDKRKRAVGQAIPWKQHRQQRTALAATAAGYQLKRGALKPLIDLETDPGEAIRWALQIPHPFSVAEPLEQALVDAIDAVAFRSEETVRRRQCLLQEWAIKAQACLDQSDQILQQIPDRALRLLLRGVPDDQSAKLGSTCNFVLYQAFAQSAQSPDMVLASDLLRGFPIVGEISPSKRWPPYDKEQTIVSLEELHKRATLEDVHEGSSLGPFESEEEASRALGQDDWIPTQRFEVVQKNKVRGRVSATTNLINHATVITEKLQLPYTDTNVAALRSLRSKCVGQDLAGWVLDERKAYIGRSQSDLITGSSQ